jgi:hypothetical protein
MRLLVLSVQQIICGRGSAAVPLKHQPGLIATLLQHVSIFDRARVLRLPRYPFAELDTCNLNIDATCGDVSPPSDVLQLSMPISVKCSYLNCWFAVHLMTYRWLVADLHAAQMSC